MRQADTGTIARAPSPNAKLLIAKLETVTEPKDGAASQADFILVGGGVGGCTDAGKLISAGHEVLMFERGGDELPVEALVPAWHPIASEHDAITPADKVFTAHNGNPETDRRDPKYVPGRGFLKMHGSGLGGGMLVNAMFTVRGHDEGYRRIMDETGDPDWHPNRMQARYDDLVRTIATPTDRWLGAIIRGLGFNYVEGRGADDPVVRVSTANPLTAIKDPQLRTILWRSALFGFKELGTTTEKLKRAMSLLNANDRCVQNTEGPAVLQEAVDEHGRRNGPREYLLRKDEEHPGKLKVITRASVEKILFNDQKRAIGVCYRDKDGTVKEAHCRREVHAAAGAIGTAGLLLRSGIGPKTDREALGIDVVKDANVGQTLGGRREITLVYQLKKSLALLEGATFKPDLSDRHFKKWKEKGIGIYASNGQAISFQIRTNPHQKDPDAVVFILPGGDFRGYKPGYSKSLVDPSKVTIAILMENKGKTVGTVTLDPANPMGPPIVNHRFDEEDDEAQNMASMERCVDFVRRMVACWGNIVESEVWPGPEVKGRAIWKHARENQWDHHPCNTTPMGHHRDPRAVVNSCYQMIGIPNLRIVDASVQANTGLFMWAPTMVGAAHAAELADKDARLSAQSGAHNWVSVRTALPA